MSRSRHPTLSLLHLGDGRHSSEDIPRLAAEAAAAHPGLAFSISPPLGPHGLLAELLLRRAGETAPGQERT